MKLTYQQEKAIHQSLINNSSIDLSQLSDLTKPYKAVLDLFMKYPNSLSAKLSVVTLDSNFLECIIGITIATDHKLSRKEFNSIDKLSLIGGELFYKEIITSRYNHNLLLACYLKAMGASVTSNSLEYINCKFKRTILERGPQGLYDETLIFSPIVASMALSDITGTPRHNDSVRDILMHNVNMTQRRRIKTVKANDHYQMEIVEAVGDGVRTVLKITPGSNSSSVVDLPKVECIYSDHAPFLKDDEHVQATQLFYSTLIGSHWSFSDIPTTPLKVEPTPLTIMNHLYALNIEIAKSLKAVGLNRYNDDVSILELDEIKSLKEAIDKVSEVLK